MAERAITPELAAEWRAAGAWQERPLHSVIDDLAESQPDALAVADQTERMSFRELVERSSGVARWLLEQGLDAGDTVVVQTRNRLWLPLMHLACDRADLTYVPMSSSFRQAEMRHLYAVARPRLAIVPEGAGDFDFLSTTREIQAAQPELRAVGSIDDGGDFMLQDVPRETDVFAVPRDPDAARFVMITSGTTELPRMSLWTDNNLWFFMREYGAAVAAGPNDVSVGLAPANTGSTGYVFPILGPLLHGAATILLEEWSPRAALELLERERATMAAAVPTQIVKMLQDSSVGQRDFSSLRVFTNGGAPMSAEARLETERVFSCIVQTAYGASDGGVPTMTTVRDPREKRATTVGRVLPHTELRLLAPDDQEVPVGEEGEVAWRSPMKTVGYLNDPERTAAVFSGDGWYRSGDLGRIDTEGYLTITGRLKDLIIRGGQNISPREVEELIATHPGVSEVSVIGVPDPVLGERACACVVPRSGQSLSLGELTAYLERFEVAKYKLPERLEVFDDLPKNTGAKIAKVELRTIVLERMGQDPSPR